MPMKAFLVNSLRLGLINLPTPGGISSMWNFGSLLGVCLITQLLSGIFLVMKLKILQDITFFTVMEITETSSTAVVRYVHANGASMFFICLYLHIARGIYYKSYHKTHTWMVGVTILFLVMATAFLGYVLPWGQMSFWGASVIIGLLSALPLVGSSIAIWLWGSFSITDSTLSRFLTFHYLLPFVLAALIMLHIIFLHESGSNNPVTKSVMKEKISFLHVFTWKDSIGALIMLSLFLSIAFLKPDILGDAENFILADNGTTPLHIMPEWYYLFAYAILRAIPNKLGGVLALVASIAILYTLPLFPSSNNSQHSPKEKVLFWSFISLFVALTWIGANPVEDPFISIGKTLTYLYFLYFALLAFNP